MNDYRSPMISAAWAFSLATALLLAGCSGPLRPKDFAATTPAFDPVAFWTGRTSSWGVIETRGGAPNSVITTDPEIPRSTSG